MLRIENAGGIRSMDYVASNHREHGPQRKRGPDWKQVMDVLKPFHGGKHLHRREPHRKEAACRKPRDESARRATPRKENHGKSDTRESDMRSRLRMSCKYGHRISDGCYRE